MFAERYFNNGSYAPRYFPKVGATPPPPSGQSPRASRYRLGHQVDWVHTLLLMALGSLWA